MADPTNLEQLLLEYLNETRLDPLKNAARYITSYSPLRSSQANIQGALDFFHVSGTALQNAYNALTPVQPLAWSSTLNNAARDHNQVMIQTDTQTHQGPNEPGLGQRANNAGYTGWNSLAENVFAYGEDMLYTHAGFMVDWGNGPDGMQSPPGHRNTIMNGSLREVGIGVTPESNSSTQVGPNVVTQDFGSRSNTSFVLGVAYFDSDGNDFYSLGEGRGGLNVQLGTLAAVSAASGGYTMQTTGTGQQTLHFTGAGLAGDVAITTQIGGSNVKIDLIDGNMIALSQSATIAGPVSFIQALGVTGLTLTATGTGNHQFTGTRGNDVFDAGAGDDTAYYGLASSQFSWTVNGNIVMMSGPLGSDRLVNFEHLRFTDRVVDLTAPVAESPLVDDAFYRALYRDIPASVDPDAHYEQWGWREGRLPNGWFDTRGYLAVNTDVRAGNVNPLTHYDQYGWREGRDPSVLFDTRLYLIHNPDVANAGVDPLKHYIEWGRAEGRPIYAAIGKISAVGFDAQYYLMSYPDVASAGADPYRHYLDWGWREGRDPNAYFDTSFYLANNPDVRAGGVDPLQHYHDWGWREGRDPSALFDTSAYLQANPDVAAGRVDPLVHFLQYGVYELRDPTPVIA